MLDPRHLELVGDLDLFRFVAGSGDLERLGNELCNSSGALLEVDLARLWATIDLDLGSLSNLDLCFLCLLSDLDLLFTGLLADLDSSFSLQLLGDLRFFVFDLYCLGLLSDLDLCFFCPFPGLDLCFFDLLRDLDSLFDLDRAFFDLRSFDLDTSRLLDLERSSRLLPILRYTTCLHRNILQSEIDKYSTTSYHLLMKMLV